ncbi:T9SS type B sorting domain-containing protein [Salinimicrobium gaetbulicola]|uniref:T9SS type B sorting domain-containing protein n=1 Tax=Salinimicrobium gaetbulicola TaxID=999702 RepID=A0ABW3IJA2_9FLAO
MSKDIQYLCRRMKKVIFFIILFIPTIVNSQLNFCPGSKGDPIFHETFGSGEGTGAALPSGVTSYTFVSEIPYVDGQYTITNNTGQNNGNWHYLPSTTVSNGKALIVNAAHTAGKFYETTVSGLCEATTYEFSAFLMNAFNPSNGACVNIEIPINVKFQILDQTGSVILAEGNTGDIYSSVNPVWTQKALTFRSEPGQHEVILKMYNNGGGGCGNDLAIDDIIFRSCGDLTEVVSSTVTGDTQKTCKEDIPATVELTASPDGSVYTSHFFQWQESTDEVNWLDISGATSNNYSASSINETTYFRVKVAEDAVNLNDNFCSSASEPFAVLIAEIPLAPQSEGDVSICEGGQAAPLKVRSEANETVRWFDQATGGNLLTTGNAFIPSAEGTYYAEAVKTDFECMPGPRTAVTLKVNSKPYVENEFLQICQGSQISLDAGSGDLSYQWNTGSNLQTITVSQPADYSVRITNSDGCSATKNFEVRQVDIAGISGITSEDTSIIIETFNPGTFEYSLDGYNFQLSNIFYNVPGGIYTAYVRDLEGCNTVTKEFPHIVVPQFITPNNDGRNDRFELKGVEFYGNSEIRIFDRYGKLLAAGSGANFSWDGTWNGRDLPSEDYWYHIFIEGFEPIKGHFTLRR